MTFLDNGESSRLSVWVGHLDVIARALVRTADLKDLVSLESYNNAEYEQMDRRLKQPPLWRSFSVRV